ncbi:MAG: hypothetical protein Q4D79_08965 [Propionibacteriaceae bacterium]|nr:hypothetical protein [Propionibacteriaceae bacterium]
MVVALAAKYWQLTMPGGQFYVTLQLLTITVYDVGLAGAAVLLAELLGVRRRARAPRRVLAQGVLLGLALMIAAIVSAHLNLTTPQPIVLPSSAGLLSFAVTALFDLAMMAAGFLIAIGVLGLLRPAPPRSTELQSTHEEYTHH